MLFWKSPINKVIRTHEAAIIWLLIGIIIGLILPFFVPNKINLENISTVAKLCGGIENVKYIKSVYTGEITTIGCKDNTVKYISNKSYNTIK